ncbi:ABC transporter substrate-binding protein [Paenibacillus aestuarii]|uniref:ABC transporter substrate-binding protein n=1 Tax=Paenibacillus aestuarii TaxID=516965 RepID=A0ABW0K680_9BACL|nr:extracellular solute-binding protein [Paenibacillus aestuarii]
MKKMKALLLMSLISSMGLSACSTGGSAPAASTSTAAPSAAAASAAPVAKKEDNISIRFAWWGDGKRHEKYNAIADMYEKQHPNVKIVREFGSFNDYWDKMATQTAGGNMPDVVGMHATYVADYARRNTLLDLGSFVQDGTINLKDFPPAVQEAGKVNGKTVMVAQGVTMTGWEFNTAMFDKLGVKYPDYNWTWDDFTAKALELQKAIKENGVWAAGDNSGDITGVQVFARQRGKELFTAEGKLGVGKDDMVAWFSIWDQLRKAKAIPDAATTEQYATVSLDQGLFVKNKVMLTVFPFNQIPLYQNYIKDGEVRALRRPLDPKGKEGEFVEGAYLAVSANSKQAKTAADFINFFVNNEEAEKVFKLEQGALGSTKGNETIKPLLSPAEQRTTDAIQTSLKTAGQLPLPPAGQGAVRTLLTETAQSIAFGKRTVDQGAQDFVDKAAAILNK